MTNVIARFPAGPGGSMESAHEIATRRQRFRSGGAWSAAARCERAEPLWLGDGRRGRPDFLGFATYAVESRGPDHVALDEWIGPA